MLAILLAFLSALILISLDISLLNEYIERYFFRSINEGLSKLRHFEVIPVKGPRQGIIRVNDISFSLLIIAFRGYFPDVLNKHKNQKIMGIVCETALQFSSEGYESMLNPVFLWFDGEPTLTPVCSLNELRVLIKNYKQRILNRYGLFFLFLSLIFQGISLY